MAKHWRRAALRWFSVFAFQGCLTAGDDLSLIRVGEAWKYFKGITEPSAPVSAWRNLAFDDTNWPSAVSGFSYGKGEYEDATILTDMPDDYVSVYFWKAFVVANPAEIEWLTLRLDYGDGFVAYLNGVEIARQGLTGTNPLFDQRASAHPPGWAEHFEVSSHLGLLRPGTNILAVQVHTISLGSPQFTFVPELLANFTRAPYVQNVSTNGAHILWQTARSGAGFVEYGQSPTLGARVASIDSAADHHAILSGLEPDRVYHYRVGTTRGDRTVYSPRYSFRTLKN